MPIVLPTGGFIIYFFLALIVDLDEEVFDGE